MCAIRTEHLHRALGATCALAAVAGMTLSVAPDAAADATGNLQAAVNAARGSSCPVLERNPILDQLAQRSNLSTQSYIEFTTRSQPIGSPKGDPMPALRQLGVNANHAKMLSGYGDPDIEGYGDVTAKAIYGATLQGYEAIPDCAYTKVGVDVLRNADKGYALATVILADAP
jgi:hypothetical protein